MKRRHIKGYIKTARKLQEKTKLEAVEKLGRGEWHPALGVKPEWWVDGEETRQKTEMTAHLIFWLEIDRTELVENFIIGCLMGLGVQTLVMAIVRSIR